MSIVRTAADAVDVPVSAGGRMSKRVNNGAAAPPPVVAGALVLTGPPTGNNGSASRPFVVAVDGDLSASFSVTLSLSGISGTLSTAAVTLTPAAPSATFTLTPTAEGQASVTASAPGLSASVATFTSLPAGTAAPSVANWLVWTDPARAWETGTVDNYLGNPNQVRAHIEFDAVGTGDVYSIDTYKADGTYAGAAPSLVDLTATELRRGVVTPTYAVIRRVTDPAVGTRQAFQMRLDKDEAGWTSAIPRWRAEVLINGTPRRYKWGEEVIAVWGVYLPAEYLLSRPQSGYYDILFQYHDDGGGCTKNPPINIKLVGGDGAAANAAFTYELKRYTGEGWPDAPVKGSTLLQSGTIVRSPAADTWHYFVFHYRENCGFSDPTPGRGDIYGPTGVPNGFVRIYYAQGESDPPALKVDFSGFWGGPIAPTHANAALIEDGKSLAAGYLKCGMYAKTNLEPAASGTLRSLHTRGFKQWLVAANPLIDAYAALDDYRT